LYLICKSFPLPKIFLSRFVLQKEGAEIGNREYVSEKDLEKLKAKYSCGENSGTEPSSSFPDMMIDAGNQLLSLFSVPA